MEAGQPETESASAPSPGAAKLDVFKPAAGAVTIVESGQTQDVSFKFAFGSAKLAILDVDLVVIFDDGGKIILPGLAVRMLGGDAPKLRFLDQDVDPSSVIARVGDVQLADQLPQLVVSAALKVEKQDPVAPSNGIPVVQMPSLPPASLTPSPARRGTIDTEIETGSISASSGRFARRTNALEEVASGGTGGQTESNDPAEAAVIKPDNAKPTLTSNGGGDQASLTMAENTRGATKVEGTDPEKNKLQYAIAGGVDADKFAINSATGELYLVRPADFETPDSSAGNNVYAITIAVVDEFGGTDEQDLSVQITDVNEAPTASVLSSNSLAETALAGTVVGTVTGVDPDAASILTFAFTAQGNANGRFVINGTTGVITVAAGAVLDAEANPQETVTVRVTDQDGLFYDKVFVLNIADMNEAPVIVSDGGGPVVQITLPENLARISTVSARDPEGQGITYSLAGGADAARFTIDTATGALRFVVAPNFEAHGDANNDGRYEVIVQASDGILSDLQTFLIDVINVNEAPTGALLSADTIAEDATAGAVIGTVSGFDPDAGDVITFGFLPGGDAGGRFQIDAVTGVISLAPGAMLDFAANPFHVVTVRLTDAGGLIFDQVFVIRLINSNDAPYIVSDGGGATASILLDENESVATVVAASDPDAGALLTYTIVGGADAAKFSINPNTGVLRFLSSPDFEVPGDANGDNNYEVIVQASDGLLTDQQSITIMVNDANEAPVITSDGGGPSASLFIVENGTSVTTVAAVDQDAGSSLVYFISGGADETLFDIDSATGILRFKNAPDFEAPADANGDNIYEVIVLASDGGLADSQTVRITVTNQNETPVIISNGGGSAAAITLAENTNSVTTVTAVDPDAGAMLTHIIVGGADASKFAINATTGALTFVAAPDFELPGDVDGDNVYDVVVQVFDGLGGIDTQTIAVTVTNANDAPVITSDGGLVTASVPMAENGTAVTTVTATDADAGATLTYSIVGGADQLLFTINATSGALAFNTPANFEVPTDSNGDNVYAVDIQVSDGLGGIDIQTINVSVTNTNETPVITSDGGLATASVNVAENATAVTTVVASDPDASTTITYSIAGGADQLQFAINATTGALTFITAPDFDIPGDVGGNNVYDVIVRASDGTLIDDQAIAVTVTNANEGPVITSGGALPSVALNGNETTTEVITITASDPDASALITFSIVGGDDQLLFTINATTGQLTFAALPDFETPADSNGDNVYEIIVRASDGALLDDQSIAVTVTNANETPVITSNGGLATASVNVAENATAVTTVNASDPDASTTITYSIAGGADQLKFAINATTGALTFITAPDFDIPGDVGGNNVYDVIVRASDGTLIDDQAIAVTLTNANDAPVITSGGGLATASVPMAENGTAVTTVTATDADAGAVLTYSIMGGADQLLFTINATTGALAFNAAPNFEVPTDSNGDNVYAVDIQVSDGLGGIDVQTINVSVTNQSGAFAGTAGADNHAGTSEEDVINGSSGNDTLSGGTGNDIINGGDDADLLSGGAGNDTIIGGAGIDTLDYSAETVGISVNTTTGVSSGGSANDIFSDIEAVISGSGNDTLTGSGATTYLSGGAGNDTFVVTGADVSLYGQGGADTFTGAAGFEYVRYSDSSTAVTVNLLTGSGVGGDAQGDVYTNIEGIEGSNVGDVIVGNNAGNRLYGYFGSDTITGGTGADSLYGGYVFASGAADNSDIGDSLNAGDGNDTVYGAGGNDTVYGGAGNDLIFGGRVGSQDIDAGNDVLNGGAGNDTIDGDAGNDTAEFSGALLDFTITKLGAVYTVIDNRGGSPDGTDTITNVENFQFTDGTISAASIISGTPASEALAGTASNDIIFGLAGDNTISGAIGNDILLGGNGNDSFSGDQGSDTLLGGNGNDTLYGEATNSALNTSFESGLANWTATGNVSFGLGYTPPDGLNAANFSAGDTPNNGVLSQSVATSAGQNYSLGFDFGAAGIAVSQSLKVELIDFATSAVLFTRVVTTVGSLTPVFQHTDVNFTATGANTTMRFSDVSGTTANVDLVLDNIRFYANYASADSIHGGNGNDLLIGGGGSDTLNGGDGNDRIEAGAGNDTIDGGADIDTVYFSGKRAEYTITDNGVTYSLSDTRPGNPDGADAVTNVENFQFADGVINFGSVSDIGGSAAGENLSGGAEANVILGFAGNDTISGNSGDDRIDGGADNDSLTGDAGDDTLIGGIGNNTLTGGIGTDLLDASAAGSTVVADGGADNDMIIVDTAALESILTGIVGGSGSDTIRLSGAGPNIELSDILGKVSGVEQIDASSAGSVLDFSNATATDIRSILGISSGTGTLILDFDGTGPFSQGTGQFVGGNDTFTVGAGQFTTFDGGTNTTTFFADGGMTAELAKVQVI